MGRRETCELRDALQVAGVYSRREQEGGVSNSWMRWVANGLMRFKCFHPHPSCSSRGWHVVESENWLFVIGWGESDLACCSYGLSPLGTEQKTARVRQACATCAFASWYIPLVV